MISLTLPIPPSTNNLYFNRKDGGRAKSSTYMAWIKEAGLMLLTQRGKPIVGHYGLIVSFPVSSRRDLDNIKAIPDLLVRHHITADDRLMWKLEVRRDPAIAPGQCRVVAYAIDISDVVAA